MIYSANEILLFDRAKKEAPILWGHISAYLVKDELLALADVILNHRSFSTNCFFQDKPDLDRSFTWSSTPQGDRYWRTIHDDIMAGKRVLWPDGDSIVGDADEPVERKWKPDEARDDVMDITKDMFQ